MSKFLAVALSLFWLPVSANAQRPSFASPRGPVTSKPISSSSASGQLPTIGQYTPFGAPGSVVTVTGSGFGTASIQSSVCVTGFGFAGCRPLSVVSWGDQRIAVTVPLNMPLGLVYLVVKTALGQSNSTSPFTVGVPPQISNYTPTFGGPLQQITITGQKFGVQTATSAVYATSAATGLVSKLTVSGWTDSLIAATIPPSFPNGKIYLSVFGENLLSIGTYPFTVGNPPVVANCNPTFGPATTNVVLTGSGFGASASGNSLTAQSAVTQATVILSPSKWTNSEIDFTIPATMAQGKYYLFVVSQQLQSTNTITFVVGTPPVISGLNPESGAPGSKITMSGSGFGNSQNGSTLTIVSDEGDETQIAPISWSDTAVSFAVPNVGWGKYFTYVTVNGLTDVNTWPFYVGIPPVFANVDPPYGPVGTVVTVTGSGFGNDPTTFYVLNAINDAQTSWPEIVSWSPTEIQVKVPDNMPTGKVFLETEVNELYPLGWWPFTVGVPPKVSGVSPAFGTPGSQFVVNGNFDVPQGDGYVTLQQDGAKNFSNATVVDWQANQITAQIPTNLGLARYFVYAVQKGLQSLDSIPLTAGIPPQIDRYSPSSGRASTVITITGEFGPPDPGNYVWFIPTLPANRGTLEVLSWTNNQITAQVTPDMVQEKIYIGVHSYGLDSIGTYPFTVGNPPQIASAQPEQVVSGTTVTIIGSNFGGADEGSTVDILSPTGTWAHLTPDNWTNTKIMFAVPSDVASGFNQMFVTVKGLQSIGTYPLRMN